MTKDNYTRARILSYAEQQFATVGYSNVSTSQIASDLKMSKSTLYKYFTSKEELLFAVIDNFYISFDEEIQSIINDDSISITEKIQAFLMSVRKRFSKLPVSVVEDIRRSVPKYYLFIEERRKNLIIETLVGLFEKGVKEDVFRSDIPPFIIVNVLIQAQQYLEKPEVLNSLNYNFLDMFHQVFTLIMEGSLSEKGRELMNVSQ